MEEDFERIVSFLRERTLYKGEINRSMTLYNDFGITGDDGIEFIDNFAERFDIEMPEQFDYSKHFGPEGLDLIGAIRSYFKKSLREELIPISVRDLEKIIERKKWTEDSE